MMKRLIVATSLLAVIVSSGAFAAPVTNNQQSDRPRQVVSSSGRTRWVIQNPNDCAPWLPEPVYAPGPGWSKMIGYRCYYNPNG
jgi:hypothetical protein